MPSNLTWEAFLKPEERRQLDVADTMARQASQQRRAIYLRCYKRMKAAERRAKKERPDAND